MITGQSRLRDLRSLTNRANLLKANLFARLHKLIMQKTLNHSIASILYNTMDETILKELLIKASTKDIDLQDQLSETLADNFDEPLNNLLHKHLLINQYDFE